MVRSFALRRAKPDYLLLCQTGAFTGAHWQADTCSPPARNINNITLRLLPSSITTLFDADGADSLIVTFSGGSGYDVPMRQL